LSLACTDMEPVTTLQPSPPSIRLTQQEISGIRGKA
jgi:hypothetical protein